MKLIRRFSTVVMLGLALATPAFAGFTQPGSDRNGAIVVSNQLGGGGQLGATATSETLPFTGLNLVLIVLGGAALVGTGVALKFRRDHEK